MCRRSSLEKLPSQASGMHGRSDQASLSLQYLPVCFEALTTSCQVSLARLSEQPELITKETQVNSIEAELSATHQEIFIRVLMQPSLRVTLRHRPATSQPTRPQEVRARCG